MASFAEAADVTDVVAGTRDAHRRLIASIETLRDDDARRASLLPSWTVGHVLTHIARNADSHTRMLRASLAGEVVHQYAGGAQGRAEGIEAGAARPAVDLVGDVVDSTAALEQAWSEMTAEAWAGHGLTEADEVWPCALMPFHRWREVELHHADLGLGYSPSDWPEGYVDRELAVSLATLPERVSAVDRQRMLGWLVGRAQQPTDLELASWQARRDHYLRS